ncbi:MAG: hypothetical protein N3B10_13100 [Armatimonadetes bacterium]|nr:hypothetical protein [Armatimonadota bacterium]MCX7969404.1 hypothetical protein [Armatimonadota bacterium]MDW8144061.1 hypothetical protein [Armatimonadota bacterium]
MTDGFRLATERRKEEAGLTVYQFQALKSQCNTVNPAIFVKSLLCP